MKKLESIQALRGIAVLAVVAFHAMTVEHRYGGGDQLLPGLLQFGQSGVDLFFVISGFVMVTVTRGRFAGRGETGRFLWGRFSRIYPTYWFYYCLTAAVFLVRPGWVNATQGHQVDLLASFLLFPGIHLPLVMVAWSLIHELWFYLAFAVLLQLHERMLPPMLLLWAAIVILANTLQPPLRTPGAAYIALHPFTLEFISGALAALLLYRRSAPLQGWRTVLIPALIILPPGIALVHHFNIVNSMGLLRAATLGSLYGLLVYTAARLETFTGLQPPGVLVFFGNISYTLYLSHILVLSAIGRLWRGASPAPASLVDNAIVLPTMLLAVTGCGWLAYRLVERPALAFSHRLRQRWFARQIPPDGDGAARPKATLRPTGER
jgi:peptidoglycan/LPS O-acetylase OafA/YrhL